MSFKTYTLGEIASNTSRRFNFNNREQVCFVNTGDILDGHFLVDEKVSSIGLPGQAKKAIQKGDILYSEIRPGNKRHLLVKTDVDDYVVSTKFMVITCNQDIVIPEYLYLVLTSKECEAEFKVIADSRSGTFPQITFDAVAYYPIELPSLAQQRAVVEFIKSITGKINLSKLTNQTLEQMAQAIFKSWFVDFDPVKAKMNGEQPEGMDAATASLFPEKLVESELGLIPEGWNINYIKDFGKVVTGKTPPKKVEDAYAEEGVPFVTPSDIDSDVFVSETKRFLSESGVEAVKKSLLPEGGICVTCIGSQMGKAVISPSEAISNQQINSVVVSKDYVRNFLFLNLRRRREEIFLIGSSGSTMPIINKSTFEKLAVLTPSEELMRSFDRSVSSLLSKIHQNAVENQTLSSLRDTLLPKLLSGEIELDTQ
ncbi:restriction endonuclease subunit S [Vibrio parahaemolyticus]|nr:restriction endonuclease subunit S [Vibrio parahaemolyticus]